jgi:predicted O-methyltransferase YrrM
MPATWKGALLRDPRTLVMRSRGQSAKAQDRMVLAAAKRLFGKELDRGVLGGVLAELGREELIPPARPITEGISNDVTLGRWLYTAVRLVRPDVVVETGVASGTSSWLILNALARNGSGRLYSIDLPNHDPTRPYNVGGEATGQVVPDALRGRWQLCLGDSRELLPRLLSDVGFVDVFFHDSDHSAEAMRREFETVLPALTEHGVIVSDDVEKNSAFADFTRERGLIAFEFRKGGTARRRG